MIYFTSDLHLGHSNILTLCSRPFSSIDEMDAYLINAWNQKVKTGDTVYLIGDVVWDKKKVAYYMEQLPGKKILIMGNHDSTWVKREECLKYFEAVTPFLEIHHCGHPITICHYPMLEWNASREETKKKLGYHIHGHIHNRVSDEYRQLFIQFNALNAGVDINGFAPVSFDELVENNMKFKLSALQTKEDRDLLLESYNRE